MARTKATTKASGKLWVSDSTMHVGKGVQFQPGEPFELDAANAADLHKRGLIRPYDEPAEHDDEGEELPDEPSQGDENQSG